jgi:hypothetical protein
VGADLPELHHRVLVLAAVPLRVGLIVLATLFLASSPNRDSKILRLRVFSSRGNLHLTSKGFDEGARTFIQYEAQCLTVRH